MDWIVTEIDGKVASIAADYRHFKRITAEVAALPPESVGSVGTRKISTEELHEAAQFLTWEDLRLFGSDFQKKVWKGIYDLSHGPEELRLYSYSELAARVDNPLGVRAVAHAVAMNPVAYVIPCHLIVPKESMDKVNDIRATALSTLFKGSDLYLLNSIEVGEYAYGSEIKRELIKLQLGK